MSKRNINIVLTKDVPNLGKEGDEVSVKPGYARNFLLANKSAVLATPVALERAARVRDVRRKKESVLLEELKKNFKGLNEVKLVFESKVKDDSSDLYGSVGASDIVKKIKEKDYDIKKSWIVLEQPIKKLGHYKVKIKPQENIEELIKIEVIAEKGKANPEKKKR